MGQTHRKDGIAFGVCDRCGKSFEAVARGTPYRFCSLACSIPPLSERFFAKVDASDQDGCWTWTGKVNGDGYGELQHEHRTLKAHRLAFEFAAGPIPDGLEVCHHCDNQGCVRPSHLFLGTHSDNMRDMIEKGRGVQPLVQGERHGSSKLTAEQVMAIRHDGRTQRDIAGDYGIAQSLVSQIKSRSVWGHLA